MGFVFIGLVILFFALSWAFTELCDRIQRGIMISLYIEDVKMKCEGHLRQ